MKPLIVAHRGASGHAPENTMRAFAKAAQLGADMIELDVQKTADGKLVVFHDDNLERCTNVASVFPDRVKAGLHHFTLEELESLDASRSLSGAEPGDDTRICALETVLDWARQESISVNIEIKSLPRFQPGLPVDIVALIKTMKIADQVIISSFNHDDLVVIKQLAWKLRTAVLTAEKIHDLVRYACHVVGANAINPGAHLLGVLSCEREQGGPLDDWLVDQARRRRLEVHVWTVNDEATMKALADIGVTAIITDFPDRAAAAFENA